MSTTTSLSDRLADAVAAVEGVQDFRLAAEEREVEFVAAQRPDRGVVTALSQSDVRGTVERADAETEYRLDFDEPVRRSPARLTLSTDVETDEDGPWTITVELAPVESAE